METRTVLVAVAGDDGDRAGAFADVVEGLSGTDEFTAHLVHVYDEADTEKIESMYDIDSRDSRALGTAARHNQAVKEMLSALDDRGVEHVTHGAIGDAGTEVVDLAARLEVDFVVVGGGGRSPTGKAIFGSTAQDVLMNAPCPVVYCRHA
jgi:nucleotide-binding universal stress UspA family protein